MLKILGHQLVDEIIEDGRTAIKTMGRCWKEVKLSRATVTLQDYLGNPLLYEPITIRITGESEQGEVIEPYEGICEDGIIDLSGYEAGDKLVIESLAVNMENAKIEVVV